MNRLSHALQLPLRTPEYYSFFQPIQADFSPLTALSLPVCRHIPLPAEKTYPLPVYLRSQGIRSACRLSEDWCI